ncbi:MAG: hypothetical protein IIY78_05190 [Clostridia bacterium]|nr:hypothetical protein [Clostridia bacterium]
MKQLKKYCLTSRTKFYLLSIIVCAILEVLGAAVLLSDDEDGAAIEDPVIAAVIAGVVILIGWLVVHHSVIVVPRRRFKKRLKYFQQQGLLNYALSDIKRGVTKFDGRVLLGEYCIMGKGTGLIVFYNEIGSMYVKITTSTDDDGNTFESWDLKIDANGVTYDICTVTKNAKSIKEWAEICTFLQLKAPNILIK